MDLVALACVTGVDSNDMLGAEKEAKLAATLREGEPGDPLVAGGGDAESGGEEDLAGLAGIAGAPR